MVEGAPGRSRVPAGGCAIIGVLLVLMFYCGADQDAQGVDPPQYFWYKTTQLRSLEFRGQTVPIKRGRVLYPLTTGESRERYQPILLCNDLELSFDESGLSQPVDFEGFCHAAKYTPATKARPEEKLQWEVTGVRKPDLAMSRCDEEKRRALRAGQIAIPLPINPDAKKRELHCPYQIEDTCIDQWRIDVEPLYKMDYDEILAAKKCSPTEWIRRGKRIGFILVCDLSDGSIQ